MEDQMTISNQTIERCIEECLQCLRWCAQCRAESLEQDPIMMRECIRLRSEEHTSELQSHLNLVCRLLLEKKNTHNRSTYTQFRSRARRATSCATIPPLYASRAP